MAEHRITPSNPIRPGPGLDHARCAALHNLIVSRGWSDSGRPLSALDHSTWWDLYSDQIDSSRLSPDLVSFLLAAEEGYVNSGPPEHNFHRYIAGLTFPDQIFENAIYGPDEDDGEDRMGKRRFVTLYSASWGLGTDHPLGCVYDQETAEVMMHMSMGDSMVTRNGRQRWVKLEEWLEALLVMMDEGKVRAMGEDYDEEGRQERVTPWIMPSFSEVDLREALEAWDGLVGEVEGRIGSLTDVRQVVGISGFTAEERAVFPEHGFARRFLEAARRPRFKFVAPGLRLARRQPFALVPLQDEEEGQLRPVLLFENDQIAHQDIDNAPWGQALARPLFHPHFQGTVSPLPAGLYLTESDPKGTRPFEDGVKLILPFRVGAARYARTSDLALLGEDRISTGLAPRSNAPRSSELYQSGYNPFIGRHDVQLRRVIRHWRDMIQSGKWEVDEDGVTGGIEKWQEADTEDQWRDYVLVRSW